MVSRSFARLRHFATLGLLLLASQVFALPPVGPALDAVFFRPQPEPLGPSSRRSGIVISEVMHHPAARPDGRNVQFIEVFNSLPWLEEMNGWQITGDVNFTFPTNFVLNPQSFVVIAAVPDDLAAATGLTNVLGPFTGKLSPGNGKLKLVHRSGAVLFELSYSSDPPWSATPDGGGHSLVLARPSYGERDPRAWDASAYAGGSPGLPEPAITNDLRTVVINEVLAKSADGTPGFLELFNYANTPADVGGVILTDDAAFAKFVFPTNSIIAPLGFISVPETALSFNLSTGGETVFLYSTNGPRVLDSMRYGPQEAGVSSGRVPDGAPGWQRLASPTPGTGNAEAAISPVVINELMYDPVSGNDAEQFVELHNPGDQPVLLADWQLQDGVKFTFPTNAVLPPRGFVVVGLDTVTLATLYPNLNAQNLFGNYSGKLSHGGDRLALARPVYVLATNNSGVTTTNLARRVVVDEVTYGTGGRWGRFSAGGGSSLELRNPRSDRRLAPNWADSDETTKSTWVNVEATGVLDNGNQAASSLEIILYGPGECLLDNVEVIGPGGTNRLANGDFETGITGWVFQGNHGKSSLETTEGFQSNQSLHLRAAGSGHTGPNRLRVPLRAALSSGQTATLRAKVRWLKGDTQLLLRLHGNWVEAPGNILAAHNLGSPGRPNTQAAPNPSPAITEVSHYPTLPGGNQLVTVTARVSDPSGLNSLMLRWRKDPAITLTDVVMTNNGAGLFSATIPGQALNSLVAYRIEAANTAGAAASFPADAPARECLIRWGDVYVKGALGSYHIWMTAATVARWSTREKLSNDPLDVTFAYANSRAIYNSGSQYSGSPYHAPGWQGPTSSQCDYLVITPPDEPLLGETELELLQPGNGGGDGTCQNEIQSYWIAEQLGIPFCHHRSVILYVNGVRRGVTYSDAQQPNGEFIREWFPNNSNGDLRKIQLWFEFDAAGSSFDAVGADLSNYTSGGVKKPARYRWIWPRRASSDHNDFTNIFALVDAVNSPIAGETYTRRLQGATDVDNWFRTHITEHIVGNNDSYSYGGGQNMYAYKPVNEPWRLMIWDIDFAFQSLGATSDMFGIGGQNVGPVNTHPPFARIYWQGLIDAVNGPLLAARANAVLDSRYNGIRTNGGTGVSAPTATKTFVAARRTYILNLINGKAAKLAITSNGGTNFSTDNNFVTLNGTAPLAARSLTLNGQPMNVIWTGLTNWTAQVPLAAATNALVIAGLDPRGVPITNAPATVTVTLNPAPEPAAGRIVIHEVMHHPVPAGAGYLELRNLSTTTTYDLSGWRLEGLGFTFPPATYLRPSAYAVIVEDTNTFAKIYGTAVTPAGVYPGTYKPEGETLRLIQPRTATTPDVVVDTFTYESAAPWPAGALSGAALQLLDPTKDNNRVANWDAVPLGATPPQPEWKRAIATGTASSSALYIYLNTPGDAYLDDIKMVAGTNPDVGANLLVDGDFESGFPGPYVVGSILSSSSLTTDFVHSGRTALHMISTGPGSSRATAITQDITPALATGATYTLSFWYRTSPQGGTLTFRLSGTGIGTSVELNPNTPTAAPATPGLPNSLTATLPALPAVWLNELATQNVTGPVDRFGRHSPWVELFNGGDTAVLLSNSYLAGSFTNLTQWAFPAGAQIPAHGFLLTWLDGQAAQSTAAEPHASFLPTAGEGVLAFTFVGGGRTNLLDYLRYSATGPDRTLGDFPDGDLSSRHLFALPTPLGTNTLSAPPTSVFINEWMADNNSTIADPADRSYADWFELYNAGTNAVNLAGFYLSNTLTDRTQFAIPAGYVIPAGGRLLVWADKKPAANLPADPTLHVNFKLSAGGESIVLAAPDGRIIDALTFGAQLPDISEGRAPDGSSHIGPLASPSPGSANLIPAPEIFSITTINGLVTVSWTTLPGAGYQLEAATVLDAPAWLPVGNPQTATGGTLSHKELLGADTVRYYRVRLLP